VIIRPNRRNGWLSGLARGHGGARTAKGDELVAGRESGLNRPAGGGLEDLDGELDTTRREGAIAEPAAVSAQLLD
jgi:hypothetical protein